MTAPAPAPAPAPKPKFVPPYLLKLGIQPGQWTYASKLSIRALMRPTWPLKIRIWACLMLQAFGHGGDLAVVMRKADRPGGLPKVTPLLPHQILGMLNAAAVEAFRESKHALSDEQRQEMKISRQHLRRALAEMEDEDGLIVRVRANVRPEALAGFSLHEAITGNKVTPLANLSGAALKLVQMKVCVYLLAKPRPAKNLDVAINGYIGGTNSTVINTTFQQILPFLARADRSLAPAIADHPDTAAALESFVQAKAELQATVDRLVALQHEAAKCGGSTATHPADVTPDQAASPHEAALAGHPPALQPAGNPPTPVASPVQRPSAAVNPQRAEEPMAAIPAGQADRTRTSASSTAADSTLKNPTFTEAEVCTVLDALLPFCPAVDLPLVRHLIKLCRAMSPHCTAVDIAEAVKLKGPMSSRKDNPAGFLLTAVPHLFDGAGLPRRWSGLGKSERLELDRGLTQQMQASRLAQQIDSARLLLASPEGECPYCGNRPPEPPCVHGTEAIRQDRIWAREVLAKAGLA